MQAEYVTKEVFEEHIAHSDTKFAKIELLIEKTASDLRNDINDLRNEINKEKVTTKRFWIGLSIPSFLSFVSILVTLFN